MKSTIVLAFGLTLLAAGAAQAQAWQEPKANNSFARAYRPSTAAPNVNPYRAVPPAAYVARPPANPGQPQMFRPYRGVQNDTSVFITPAKPPKPKTYGSGF